MFFAEEKNEIKKCKKQSELEWIRIIKMKTGRFSIKKGTIKKVQ